MKMRNKFNDVLIVSGVVFLLTVTITAGIGVGYRMNESEAPLALFLIPGCPFALLVIVGILQGAYEAGWKACKQWEDEIEAALAKANDN